MIELRFKDVLNFSQSGYLAKLGKECNSVSLSRYVLQLNKLIVDEAEIIQTGLAIIEKRNWKKDKDGNYVTRTEKTVQNQNGTLVPVEIEVKDFEDDEKYFKEVFEYKNKTVEINIKPFEYDDLTTAINDFGDKFSKADIFDLETYGIIKLNI